MRAGKRATGRPLIAIAATIVVGGAAAQAEARPVSATKDGRPNILVVMTDDMAATDVEHMPNVRKLLAKKGTSFADAVDSFPLCCPARATFLTGQYAHNHGVAGNFHPDGWYGMKGRGNTLATWLDDAGYTTALIGKWLNGYGALDAHGEVPKGFDIWRGLLDAAAYDYYNYVMNKDGKLKIWGDSAFAMGLVRFANIEVTPHEHTLATVFAALAEQFGPAPYEYWGAENEKEYQPDVTGKITKRIVRGQAKSRKPFFVWWTPVAPHREDVATTLMGRPGADPRPAPRYADEAAEAKLPQPPNFNEADLSDKASNMTEKAQPLSEEQIAQLQLDYEGRVGSLMAVDEHVGKLVKTLRKTDQLRNTMIVFLSDNGWMQGEHRIPGDKFLPYEESLKIPLIIRGPGVPKGREINRQVANIDFAPTLADAANAKAGRTLDGVSLLPSLLDPKRKPPERVFELEALTRLFEGEIPVNAWDRPYKGVRTERYTYVVWTETGEQELYDRQVDPYQLENVVDDPGYAAVRDELAAKLEQLDGCAGKDCRVKP
jgi:N-acetylglucosamine-6-sulfatase